MNNIKGFMLGLCGSIILLLLVDACSKVYAQEHYPGPGWIGYNCDSLHDPYQNVLCNTIAMERLVLQENGWEIWEFDDSYILLEDREERFTWDCLMDNDTDKANQFFCEVMMGYNYE